MGWSNIDVKVQAYLEAAILEQRFSELEQK